MITKDKMDWLKKRPTCRISFFPLMVVLGFVFYGIVYSGTRNSVSSREELTAGQVTLGVGTAEIINLGASIQIFRGLYGNVTVGKALIQGGSVGTLGSFVKVGAQWKFSKDLTGWLASIDGGPVIISSTHGTSDKAYLVSFVLGREFRFDSGFELSIEFGGRYSHRDNEVDRTIPGFQLGVGVNF